MGQVARLLSLCPTGRRCSVHCRNFQGGSRAFSPPGAQIGRLAEAREIVRRVRALTPLVVPSATQWRNPEQRELYLAGLRLATGEVT